MSEDKPNVKPKPAAPIVGFWSTQTLRAKLGDIVTPYDDPSRTREATHRLAMGREYFITRSALEGHTGRHSMMRLKCGESFCIPSGHFGFLLTEETVCMPHDAIGFISIQTDVKFLGLVNVSGFHVDPGSNGKLIFSVFNAGPDPVHIKQGDPIFRLWIASLDAVDEEPRSQPSHDSIPSEMVNRISGDLESLQTLAKRIGTMESRLNFHRGVVGVGATLLAGAFIALVILILQGWVSSGGNNSTDDPQRSSTNSSLQSEVQRDLMKSP